MLSENSCWWCGESGAEEIGEEDMSEARSSGCIESAGYGIDDDGMVERPRKEDFTVSPGTSRVKKAS